MRTLRNDRRRPLFVGESSRRIVNRHLLDDSFTQARLSEQREELSLQMIVSLATITVQVLFQADIQRKQKLFFETLSGQFQDIAGSHFVGGVTVALITDIIDAKVNSLFSDASHMGGSKSISQMADNDPVRRNTLFPQSAICSRASSPKWVV